MADTIKSPDKLQLSDPPILLAGLIAAHRTGDALLATIFDRQLRARGIEIRFVADGSRRGLSMSKALAQKSRAQARALAIKLAAGWTSRMQEDGAPQAADPVGKVKLAVEEVQDPFREEQPAI